MPRTALNPRRQRGGKGRWSLPESVVAGWVVGAKVLGSRSHGGQAVGGGWPGDPAACVLGPHFHPPCRALCQKARDTPKRMEAEFYSSWLGKRTSRWLCTGPPPLTPPRTKEDRQGHQRAPSARLSPLLEWRQVSAAQGRVCCSDRVARAPGLRWGCCSGGGGWVQGHFSSWELLAGTELRAPGHGRGCLGCAHHPI